MFPFFLLQTLWLAACFSPCKGAQNWSWVGASGKLHLPLNTSSFSPVFSLVLLSLSQAVHSFLKTLFILSEWDCGRWVNGRGVESESPANMRTIKAGVTLGTRGLEKSQLVCKSAGIGNTGKLSFSLVRNPCSIITKHTDVGKKHWNVNCIVQLWHCGRNHGRTFVTMGKQKSQACFTEDLVLLLSISVQATRTVISTDLFNTVGGKLDR